MRGHSFFLRTFGLNLVKIFILGYIVLFLLDIHIQSTLVLVSLCVIVGLFSELCVVLFRCVLLYCWVVASVVCNRVSLYRWIVLSVECHCVLLCVIVFCCIIG